MKAATFFERTGQSSQGYARVRLARETVKRFPARVYAPRNDRGTFLETGSRLTGWLAVMSADELESSFPLAIIFADADTMLTREGLNTFLTSILVLPAVTENRK